jgi:hypothetical protein
MPFDDDDDVRRAESDELHGHAGGWYSKDSRIETTDRGLAQVWPDTYRLVEGVKS